MREKKWFSAKVRTVCLVEHYGADSFMDMVFVFRAESFEDALQRAIELGKCTEEEYLNVYNERVRWRLKDVITLDMIRKKSLDGAEVYSEFVDVPEDENIPFDAEFHPERSKPEHTGI